MPNGLDPRHAALTEPMAVGLDAVNKSGIERNEVALVLGCGPIGIAIVAALRRHGVETIVVADYSAKRRNLAATMGAGQTVDPAEGSPFDDVTPAVVVEAVGVPEFLARDRRGLIDVTPMIAGEVGLDGVDAAFDELSDPNRHCKIVVTPQTCVSRSPHVSTGS